MKRNNELPPGFRFHPTDDELIGHYLSKKCAGQPINVDVIKEINLYQYDPWQLPELCSYGEKEWYFFSRRDKKYPNGSRPNRAAGTGYWKATGADKPIGRPVTTGIKKSLVFYAGKAPRGVKTNWIMHEYRLSNGSSKAAHKMDDWVLCRIYNKKGCIEKHVESGKEEGSGRTMTMSPESSSCGQATSPEDPVRWAMQMATQTTSEPFFSFGPQELLTMDHIEHFLLHYKTPLEWLP